jgi:hypothetical protein
MHEFSLNADALLASFAKPRCCGEKSIDAAKAVVLTVLASCGWTHFTQVVLDDFCGVNGIDVDER